MRKIKGFALVQALLFMMFIMAIVSVAMMMSVQRNTKLSGDRLAVEAYPAAYALLSNNASSTNGTSYFANYPLSSSYITLLTKDGISDPSVDCTSDDCATKGHNLILTIS